MKNAIWIVIAVIIIIIIGVVVAHNNAPAQESQITPAQVNGNVSSRGSNPQTTPAADDKQEEVVIHIQNYAYTPATLTVKAGTKIVWINEDAAPHTVTSDTGKALDSGNIQSGGMFTAVMSDPGTYTYHCEVHPPMKGKIIVQ